MRGPAAAIRERLEQIAGSGWFAYGTILAIQAKVIWGIWDHRDLTAGDTTQYFINARDWTDTFTLDPLWSPMYTFFWGSLQWLVPDPYAVTILHRVLIVVACSLLVLAVMRRLLSPAIAWLVAVWWAILPVSFDTLYEVHLFALIPELVAVLVALTWSGIRMRSAVFGVLLATAVLMRNEIIVAVIVWAAAWLIYEALRRRRGEGPELAVLLRAVGMPTLAVGLLITAAVLSFGGGVGELRDRSDAKHSFNVCQIYAFSYQQRHDDFAGSPWTECRPLMKREFGEELPSFTEAVRANPGAMGEHVLWNVRLAPYAVQLLLFDRMSADAGHNPDYDQVTTGSVAARIGLVIVAAFIAAGLILLRRDRRRWWDEWIRERAWGWVALAALGTSAVAVMVWQRPRPSYLFALGVLILALVGMSAMAYADRWPQLKRMRAAVPVLAVVLLLALPPHYDSDYQTPQIGRPGRPLKTMVDRLHPLRDRLRGEDIDRLDPRDRLSGEDVTLLATYSGSGCPYIGGTTPCIEFAWDGILSRKPGVTVGEALEDGGVDYIYVDAADLAESAMAAAVAEARASGWTRIEGESGDDRWELLVRPGAGAESRS